jgi:hypothetical protein
MIAMASALLAGIGGQGTNYRNRGANTPLAKSVYTKLKGCADKERIGSRAIL